METLSYIWSAWSQDGVSPALTKEIFYLSSALLLAWLVTWSLGRHNRQASVLFGRHGLDGVLFPLLALSLAYICQLLLQKQQEVMLFKLAVPVLLSLALIRLSARVLMAVFPSSSAAALTEQLISWLAWGMAVLWITDLLPLVLQEMEQIHLNFGKVRLDLRTLLEGVLSCGLVLMLSLWLSATIEQKVLSQTVSDLSMRKVAANVLRAVLLLIGLLLALSAVGVDLTALSLLGGALGVGLGLGLQKLAANYVSGFVVLIERSVRIGDHIRVDGMDGRVTDIKTRFTLLRDANGRESIVPNELLITQRVDNFSLSDTAVALQTTVLLATDTPAEQVQPVLLEALSQVTEVLSEPAPQVFFSRFSADGLEWTLNFWITDQLHTRMSVMSRVNQAVWAGLQRAGFKLPPPKPLSAAGQAGADGGH